MTELRQGKLAVARNGEYLVLVVTTGEGAEVELRLDVNIAAKLGVQVAEFIKERLTEAGYVDEYEAARKARLS